MSQTFVVEIGCEELPPKSLYTLHLAFADALKAQLIELALPFEAVTPLAAPRRLAIQVNGLAETTPDKHIEKLGPAVKAAYDSDGNPSKAAQGFARGCGVAFDALETTSTPKGERLVYRSVEPGVATTQILCDLVQTSLDRLPIAKRMRWGARREEFVRPVQWILMLLGDQVVAGSVMGLPTGNTSRGHRFMCERSLTIKSADSYVAQLRESGFVEVEFNQRKQQIRSQVTQAASTKNGRAVISESLLDEVAALVEWPVALVGTFEHEFLEVPSEALISSMREHQKYFHVVDEEGALMPYFVTVSNLVSKDPAQIISGNEKVIRPRLADARFFYQQDLKTPFSDFRSRLKAIVFQQQLGTLYEKSERVSKVATEIADLLNAEQTLVEQVARAAELSKCDLVSEMVLEFDDLQGIMGEYYARAAGEPEPVAVALREQYLPKHAGDSLPESEVGTYLAIAERVDTLVGIFGIGQPPTGSKDPFALRRASLGLLRLLVEKELPLSLKQLIDISLASHSQLTLSADDLRKQLSAYCLDRFSAWFEDQGIRSDRYRAVRALGIDQPLDIVRRVSAVETFCSIPEAEALAAANKRVTNILTKAPSSVTTQFSADLFTEPAESSLALAIQHVAATTAPLVRDAEYTQALQAMAQLRAPLDTFFDSVMVMTDDETVRVNRLNLLSNITQLFMQIADISLLQLEPAASAE